MTRREFAACSARRPPARRCHYDRVAVQPGPLPPHERSWRHPSELAAEQRAVLVTEGIPRSTRIVALTSGAAGLLAIGALMVTITPRGAESPVALASTTSISAQAAVVPLPASPTGSAAIGLRSESRSATDVPLQAEVLATPIGDGSFALVTRASVEHAGSLVIDVRFPSGRRSIGSIVTASDDAVVVALLSREQGHAIAGRKPHAAEMVTVLATPPVVVPFGEVASLDVDEGTPVISGDDELVGVCSRRRDGSTRLIEARGALDAATSVVP